MATSTNERLRRIERLIFGVQRQLDSLLRAANLTIELEIEQMADFSELEAKVTKIKGTVESSKAAFAGLRAKVEELAVGMDDSADQAKVMALATELGAAEAALAEAIAANPEKPGGSTGGNTEG